MATTTLYCSMAVDRVDRLCPACFLPALMQITVTILRTTGVETQRPRIVCQDCDHRE